MIVVIVAGGSGTRLWPLSTSDYPKHLLKINGDSLSLVQHAYKRAQLLTDKIYIATEAGHIQHIRNQLSELPEDAFIVEPARRGTAYCIIAALTAIAKKHDVDEPIAFVHADHYIRDIKGFAHSFRVANEITKSEKRIVLVGVEPDYPATGFGYIKKGAVISNDKFVFNVETFKEKPDFETAQNYLNSGDYLWNGGYFVGSVNTFRETMKKYSPELFADYELLEKTTIGAESDKIYLGFESKAIDYALIEKVQNLLVVPASFDWMDLGSFADIAAVVDKDRKGNYVYGNIELEEVENAFVQNFEDKPVAVIGLDNAVVINAPNGILVVRKDLSQKVGEVSKRLNLDKK